MLVPMPLTEHFLAFWLSVQASLYCRDLELNNTSRNLVLFSVGTSVGEQRLGVR